MSSRLIDIVIITLDIAVTVIQELSSIINLRLLGLEPVSESLVLNWADLLTVLVIGLCTAFALHILLFCLGTAVALSGIQPSGETSVQPSISGFLSSGFKFGLLVGLGILCTVNLVLFTASLGATTFVHFQSPMRGAIAGVVLWAVYLGIMLWLSLVTVNSFVEGSLNILTSGLRSITVSVWNFFKHQEDEQKFVKAQVETAVYEAVQSAFSTLERELIQQHTQTALDVIPPRISSVEIEENIHKSNQNWDEIDQVLQTVWQKLSDYLQHVDLKQLSPKKLRRTLNTVFQELQEKLPVGSAILPIPIAELSLNLSQRQDLSTKKKLRMVEQIQTHWDTLIASYQGNNNLDDRPSHSGQTPNSIPSNASATDTQRASISLPDVAQMQTVIREAIAPMMAKLDTAELKRSVAQLLTHTDIDVAGLSQTFKAQASQIRDLTTEQFAGMQQTIQQSAQAQLEAVQQELQKRLENTRKTAAIAAWWLFATVLTSGISAALAGAISVTLLPAT